MNPEQLLLLIFGFIILAFLIADLGFFNRKAHAVSLKSALWQTLFWIAIAIGYGALIFRLMGQDAAASFMSAYVTEKMLSVDNLFVILLIFNFFKLEEKYHHKVLFWGILGAIIFRAIFILAGSAVIGHFHWVLYIFGIILIYTAIKLLRQKEEDHADFNNSKVLRVAKKIFRFSDNHHQGKFFTIENRKLHGTVLLLIALLIETTDIIFAVDSIPAAFSITQNSFLIFTSNIFAVMGLRALFFLIEGVVDKFHHLQKGLSFILLFIGAKMLLVIVDVHISSIASFIVIMAALALSLIASLIFPKKI